MIGQRIGSRLCRNGGCHPCEICSLGRAKERRSGSRAQGFQEDPERVAGAFVVSGSARVAMMQTANVGDGDDRTVGGSSTCSTRGGKGALWSSEG